jgi:hypothetical protein
MTNTSLTPETFSKLAAIVFALGALLQLGRALYGMPMMAGTMMVPFWASWIAVLFFGGLAWLGFTARR